MKFGKRYSDFVAKRMIKGCSYVEFKRHKKLLKRCCRRKVSSFKDARHAESSSSSPPCNCPSSCPVCDGNFFPSLYKEISEVVGCFNARAQQLLQFHLSSKFQRLLLRMKNKSSGSHREMILLGRNLVDYASMNSIAIRKILKKYDKVHSSVAGRTFRTRLQAMHAELLQSPWMIELVSLYINLKNSNNINTSSPLPENIADCSCEFEDSKATLRCKFADSQTFEVDLTCSICLETVFDPVALSCGHLFCNSCACSAACIPTIQGAVAATRDVKCPLCRQEGVYRSAVYLTELNLLLKHRFREYWVERLRRERVERVQQIKQHWQDELKLALGI